MLGLRGMKVEERTHEILNTLSRLRGDVEKLQQNFRLLGKHLTNAQNSYADSERTLTKFDAKLNQIKIPTFTSRTSSSRL
jgi:DNA anti-recombination protein RmuC